MVEVVLTVSRWEAAGRQLLVREGPPPFLASWSSWITSFLGSSRARSQQTLQPGYQFSSVFLAIFSMVGKGWTQDLG